jgi:hypothetical protein
MINLLNFTNSLDYTPFIYPLMVNDKNLRTYLIKYKIFVPKYWDEALERENITTIEKDFVNKIIPLPIDQRYNLDDMKRIVQVIKDKLNV